MSDLIGGDPFDGTASATERPHGADPRPRVLCVDHEPQALERLHRLLCEHFDVVTSSHPVEALSCVERDGDFAVVIADANMPHMNGLAFLERVQSLSPTTTRLALIGSVAVAPVALPPDVVFRVIGKPCPAEILLQTIIDAANYHRLIAASPVQPIERRQPAAVMLPSGALMESLKEPLLGPRGILDLSGTLLDPVAILDSPQAPSLAIHARVGLQMTGRTVELLPGLTIVGRSRTCHVPINDPHISRRHACFSNDERELMVRNLSSTNKLLLNDVPVEGHGPRHLEVGDRVTIGSHRIEICSFGDYTPSLEPTLRLSMIPSVTEPAPENEPVTFATLAEVAGKYVRLGQSRDAERILRPLLDGLVRHCRAGHTPLQSDVKLAADLALRFAEANHAGDWVTYVFDLLSAVGVPAEQDVLERLYRVIPLTPGISMTSYRSYRDALDQMQDRFGPAQRFLLRRIQGLETALMMSAHR